MGTVLGTVIYEFVTKKTIDVNLYGDLMEGGDI